MITAATISCSDSPELVAVMGFVTVLLVITETGGTVVLPAVELAGFFALALVVLRPLSFIANLSCADTGFLFTGSRPTAPN